MTKTERLARVIDKMKRDMEFANTELSRLKRECEVAELSVDEYTAPETLDDQTLPQAPLEQYGKINLPIHYTLGRGVADALGDRIDNAVITAFRETTKNFNLVSVESEVNYCGVGMLAELYWDRELRMTCLHLEIIHTEQQIGMEEWDAAEEATWQDRTLN